MRSDSDIKRDVEVEFWWDPNLDSTDIGVAVKNGVVTLSGYAKRYADKLEAERAAKRVVGVAGVANDIEVRIPSIDERPDPEIARDAVSAIKSRLPYASESIKVVVSKGWITLEGDVEWQYQRQTAEKAVRYLKGVRGVINSINLKPKVEASDIKRKIEDAFRRSAEIDAKNVMVETNGGQVILKGTVRSWTELKEAERAAWRAPGVTKVDNRLTLRPNVLATVA